MQRRIQDGFSILLPAADTVRMFGENIKLSCIALVPQTHRRPRLILNMLEKLYKDTPSVNDTKYREVSPESVQFGRAFHLILQEIYESDLAQVPVWVSKLDVKDAYQCGTLRSSQVGAFTYVTLSALGDDSIIICINMVLLMR